MHLITDWMCTHAILYTNWCTGTPLLCCWLSTCSLHATRARPTKYCQRLSKALTRHSVMFWLHVVDDDLMLWHIVFVIRWKGFSQYGGYDAMHFVWIEAKFWVSWIELVYKLNVLTLESVYKFNVAHSFFTAKQSIHGTRTTGKLVLSSRWGIPHSWLNVKGKSQKKTKKSFSKHSKPRCAWIRYQICFRWHWICYQMKGSELGEKASDAAEAKEVDDYTNFLNMMWWSSTRSSVIRSGIWWHKSVIRMNVTVHHCRARQSTNVNESVLYAWNQYCI